MPLSCGVLQATGEAHVPLIFLDNPAGRINHESVRKLAAHLLWMCFALIGCGVVEYWHNAHHAAEDARELAEAVAAGRSTSTPPVPHHDENNCAFHLQLHLPALPVVIAPPSMTLWRRADEQAIAGKTIGGRRFVAQVHCRGPPRMA